MFTNCPKQGVQNVPNAVSHIMDPLHSNLEKGTDTVLLDVAEGIFSPNRKDTKDITQLKTI